MFIIAWLLACSPVNFDCTDPVEFEVTLTESYYYQFTTEPTAAEYTIRLGDQYTNLGFCELWHDDALVATVMDEVVFQYDVAVGGAFQLYCLDKIWRYDDPAVPPEFSVYHWNCDDSFTEMYSDWYECNLGDYIVGDDDHPHCYDVTIAAVEGGDTGQDTG